MIYSYQRVSSREQHLERQEEAFNKFCLENEINEYQIYQDKQSGKNFERNGYQEMLANLQKGDVVVIKSLDRLGRNYDMMIEQWTYITKTVGADIVVLDMPLLDTRTKNRDITGKFISDMVLQVLSYFAQIERENIKKRQREGIDIALKNGVKFGREVQYDTEKLEPIKVDYENGMKVDILLEKHGISRTTLFKYVKQNNWKARNKRG